MILNENNKENIQKWLDDVQKKSTVRNITTEQIYEIPDIVKKHFNYIPMSKMDGLRITVNPNRQSFPRNYRFTPAATFVVLSCNGKRWKIENICRSDVTDDVYIRYGRIPETLSAAILEKYKVQY